MAYNKTSIFYFLKPENYYRQDFVRKIRTMKNGYEYLTLYEELLIESLNKDGILANIFNGEIIPYSTKELATIFSHRESIVKNALEIFQECNIIIKYEDGVYFIPGALEYTKRTTVGAEDKKNKRKKQKEEEKNADICLHTNEEKCPTYIEQDTNTNNNIEKEKNNNSYLNTIKQLNNKYESSIKEIIEYLNKKSNKKFTTNKEFVKQWIIELFEDNYTIEDFKKVIDNKTEDWANDPENRKFLRPGTLFNPKNFNKYLSGNFKKKDSNSFDDAMSNYLNE